jgi:type IV pilus assembly protein PilP
VNRSFLRPREVSCKRRSAKSHQEPISIVRLAALATGVAAMLVLSACSEQVTTSPNQVAAPVVERKPQAQVVTPDAGAPAKVELQESEFAESERSRDPFRAFASNFVEEARTQTKSQREVVMEEYSIDEMKLIGIVTGGGVEPRAMLVDPRGNGHVVRRGQFIGRAEIIQAESKGSKAYEINWRVDRIREGDVVLVREDPKNPEIPSSTRVLALHPETDKSALIEGL